MCVCVRKDEIPTDEKDTILAVFYKRNITVLVRVLVLATTLVSYSPLQLRHVLLGCCSVRCLYENSLREEYESYENGSSCCRPWSGWCAESYGRREPSSTNT